MVKLSSRIATGAPVCRGSISRTIAASNLAAAVEDLRQDLRAVSIRCRPDWDITTPDLKAAWQQGREELFYPYGKTYAQTLGQQD